MSEFTKGELKIDSRRAVLVFAANNKIFAECTSEGLGLNAAKANAKELVRRWNAFEKDFRVNLVVNAEETKQQRDDLLEALKKYSNHLGACYSNLKMGECNCGLDAAIANYQT